ncbi:putative colanic acid biosynthesis acetyltransferase [Oceaniglobus roseus]|uniref:putative colanic acid biosynthesis acetyltransferase n=1 Tax=Oceaniglobus roseus TaxID=1737570 RepID=UPI000C7F6032|nr:putative colanic acid biosynthesis acetyltransferase [Kandeliimicrobium roseum]
MESRFARPSPAAAPLPIEGGPTFALRQRAMRALWGLAWRLGAAWTPPSWMAPRRFLLTLFGARIHPTAMVRGSARIWWPGHLTMGAHASLGPGAICYNVAPVTLEAHAIVSQRSHLCAAGHDIEDPAFPLRPRPIRIGRDAWIAAEAFVGPGVNVGEGAVLGARGVAVSDLDPWILYGGNPARALRQRRRH